MELRRLFDVLQNPSGLTSLATQSVPDRPPLVVQGGLRIDRTQDRSLDPLAASLCLVYNDDRGNGQNRSSR
jgi:hypothetical protein